MWSKCRMLAGVGITVGTCMGIMQYKQVAHAQARPMQDRSNDGQFATWDENWDKRASVKRSSRSVSGSEEQSEEKKHSKARRHLIFIRHGQYNHNANEDKDRILTPLGREQALEVGARLQALDIPYDVIINSTMTRAKETSDIISEVLGNSIPRKESKLLEEGAPASPEPLPSTYRQSAYAIYRDGARIEAAFRSIFHRPDHNAKEDSYEIVVCHANVIRYFVCRALQFPPEAWLRFSLKHCSITWFTLHGNGNVSIRSVGDAGFMPPKMLTTS